MIRHLISFLKCPIGYILNVIVCVLHYCPKSIEMAADYVTIPLCETFCLNDGIQDDSLF